MRSAGLWNWHWISYTRQQFPLLRMPPHGGAGAGRPARYVRTAATECVFEMNTFHDSDGLGRDCRGPVRQRSRRARQALQLLRPRSASPSQSRRTLRDSGFAVHPIAVSELAATKIAVDRLRSGNRSRLLWYSSLPLHPDTCCAWMGGPKRNRNE